MQPMELLGKDKAYKSLRLIDDRHNGFNGISTKLVTNGLSRFTSNLSWNHYEG